MRSIHDRDRSQGLMSDDDSHTTESPPETQLARPSSAHLPSPVSSISRWSRTTYSISIYEEDGFTDDGTTAVAPSPPATRAPRVPPSLVSLWNLVINREEGKTTKFRSAGQILLCAAILLLAAGIIAVLVIFVGREIQDHPSSSSVESRKSTSSTLARKMSDTYPSTASASKSPTSTAAVVEVATQVMQTTVGTITESVSSPITSS